MLCRKCTDIVQNVTCLTAPLLAGSLAEWCGEEAADSGGCDLVDRDSSLT